MDVGRIHITNPEAAWRQLWYFRAHLDVYIQYAFKIKLTKDQCVLARMIGNGVDVKGVNSRGYGKTWLV